MRLYNSVILSLLKQLSSWVFPKDLKILHWNVQNDNLPVILSLLKQLSSWVFPKDLKILHWNVQNDNLPVILSLPEGSYYKATLSSWVFPAFLTPHFPRGKDLILSCTDTMTYFVYILASKKWGVLYTWVTNNLKRRVYEHQQWLIEWFTQKYFVKKLVYYEMWWDIKDAIQREKQLKWRKRMRKIELIESFNPLWKDLYDTI